VATITRITSGRTYPPAAPRSSPPATEPVPSRAPSHPGHRWPRGDDRVP
jgi:hypothetical protein